MRKASLATIALFPFLLFSADPPDLKEATLAAKIADLQRQLDELKDSVRKGSEFEMQMISDLLTSRHPTAEISLTSTNSFAAVDSTIGPILIAFKGATPYLTGYRIDLQIGNPHAATIDEYGYEVWWAANPPDKAGVSYPEWYKNRKHRKFRGSMPLRPGAWQPVSIILPDTSARDLGYMEVSFDSRRLDMPITPK